ncbi:hypothetical protein [Nocardioides pocheonensis]|uniref:Uncharacterized protein n=1 Tax=Nocardioides pocheonensis TaxID=661485 RepID=A0A3N0GWD0_9ACTN|nr:hypothetical protein [Nocardioides pocheonensis]RNM16402.1 hypothetical protein EFL26_05525 [Nocardioides pocheonensis]
MHRSHLRSPERRRTLAILAGAVLVAAGQLGLAAGAQADSRPAVDVAEPSVSGTSASVSFTVNRGRQAIADATCTLTDVADVVTPVPCGAPAAGPVRRSTAYATTLTDLAPGRQVFVVSITLTDGGTATGAQAFTVDEPAPVEFAASDASCRALPGGVFVAHESWWQVWSCEFEATTTDAGAAASAELGPLCLADGGIGFGGGLVAPGRYQASCWLT